MRRPTALEVDTRIQNEKADYELSQSPVSSTVSLPSYSAAISSAPPKYTPPAPSLTLLFSLLERRHVLLLLLPAIATSVLAGGIAPFMTLVIGAQFSVFARYPLVNPTDADKRALLHGVGLAAIELVALGVAAFTLSGLTSSLWIWIGERNTMSIRKRVFNGVSRKDMVWFDTQMGAEGSIQSENGQGPLGAGGLMAKFARETDDVRSGSSLAAGTLVQCLTTTFTCLVLAFQRSWSLTLVILATVPLIVLVQAFSQAAAGPILAIERSQTAIAATLVDRAIGAIATVKAFNAQAHEHSALSAVLARAEAAVKRCAAVWGLSSGINQFLGFSMFVQAFWFGAGLVRSGKVSAGDVMSVFWACLIATNNLQMCIPHFITIAKGKFAMVSLITLADEPAQSTLSSYRALGKHRRSTPIRKIVPTRCSGELNMQSISFSYPSRPNMSVLDDVSIFLPAGELTFIVGGSGSGKSTLAQLLLRMYEPLHGELHLDEQDVHFLDDAYLKQHIASVSQGCILFDQSVHDNVVMGLTHPELATRAQVEAACRAALMHEFIRDLPMGYDTMLGNGGANLSGGQKQRLAIARAMLRNPTILILDEATSALDATSRVLVFEAIKRWRRNMTTIVITHDLSQIGTSDFTYVLRGGRLAEQGFRGDLEADPFSVFREMADTQVGGFPVKDPEIVPAALGRSEPERPKSLGNWMFEAIANLTYPNTVVVEEEDEEDVRPQSHFIAPESFAYEETDIELVPRCQSVDISTLASPSSVHHPSRPTPARRLSLQFTPTSTVFSQNTMVEEDDDFMMTKAALESSGAEARKRLGARSHATLNAANRFEQPSTELSSTAPTAPSSSAATPSRVPGLFSMLVKMYPTVPCKPLVLLGLVFALLSGAVTPIFSYVLSRLMFEVSIGAKDTGVINLYGGIVLAVAAADGTFMGLKFFVLEWASMKWVTSLRERCFSRVLAQDKKWFDQSDHSASKLVQVLIKDGDDARQLIVSVLGQLLVVVSMLCVGLVWALVRGWQLTLVGLAIGPVFGIVIVVQSALVSRCVERNKRATEAVANSYYETISNIRGIRAMGFEHVFESGFTMAADNALSTGVRGAFVEGATYGVASALIYLAEALLFFMGAFLISRGTYSYLQMIEVLNMVVFTVTLGSQILSFTNRIAKAVHAAHDFRALLALSCDTDESRGYRRDAIAGPIAFQNVSFSYPERPDVPVLKNLTLELKESECLAIVGASGSGKSTVAALLQRLYEPDSGSIHIGANEIRTMSTTYLREHVSVVSQNPNLFDATIAENIAYGQDGLGLDDVKRAAMAAKADEFISSLPDGYQTMVGEKAALISGGQAQRIQIARALARPCRLLILDECTSALDSANQNAVMETVRKVKVGRTAVVVTHKLPMMRMCDRIAVVEDGRVAEVGTYDELMAAHGVFAQLARGGEWE